MTTGLNSLQVIYFSRSDRKLLKVAADGALSDTLGRKATQTRTSFKYMSEIVASHDGGYIDSDKNRRRGRRERKSMTEMTIEDADAGEMRVSSKLRHARRLRGLTLKEVADKADCSESLLSKIENGRASPSLKMLQRLASALGLTVGQVFAQENHPDSFVMRA